MRVLVAGGTGLVGGGIVRALLEDGRHEVGVLSRNADKVRREYGERVEPREGDATEPATLTEAVRGFEVLIDAVQFPNAPIENPKKGFTFRNIDRDGTMHLVDAAKEAGIRQYVVMSGAGADPEGEYHWLRYKWEEEEYVKGSGLSYTIFRPTWIFGPEDVSLNRFLGFSNWLPFVPVIGNPRINPLFVGDAGRFVTAAVGNEAAMNRTFGIGGPDVLTMKQIVGTALEVSGKRRFLLPQPPWLMKPVAFVAQFMPGRPLTPDAIDFITMDAILDPAEATEALGVTPTPLREALATYLPRK